MLFIQEIEDGLEVKTEEEFLEQLPTSALSLYNKFKEADTRATIASCFYRLHSKNFPFDSEPECMLMNAKIQALNAMNAADDELQDYLYELEQSD